MEVSKFTMKNLLKPGPTTNTVKRIRSIKVHVNKNSGIKLTPLGGWAPRWPGRGTTIVSRSSQPKMVNGFWISIFFHQEHAGIYKNAENTSFGEFVGRPFLILKVKKVCASRPGNVDGKYVVQLNHLEDP